MIISPRKQNAALNDTDPTWTPKFLAPCNHWCCRCTGDKRGLRR